VIGGFGAPRDLIYIKYPTTADGQLKRLTGLRFPTAAEMLITEASAVSGSGHVCLADGVCGARGVGERAGWRTMQLG
jgi:hypothetical protein